MEWNWMEGESELIIQSQSDLTHQLLVFMWADRELVVFISSFSLFFFYTLIEENNSSNAVRFFCSYRHSIMHRFCGLY